MRLLSTAAVLSCALALLAIAPLADSATVTVYDAAAGKYMLADATTGEIVGPAPAPGAAPSPSAEPAAAKPSENAGAAPAAPAAKPTGANGTCGAAGCNIAVNGTCYSTLGAAITAAPSGATISLASGTTVSGETAFNKSLNFVGCGGGRAKITVDMDIPQGGLLRATGNNQKVGFAKLSFVGAGYTKFSSLLRTPELGDGEFPVKETTGPVSLTISDCDFTNFKTQARGGAVIFIGRTGAVSITDANFTANRVGAKGERYEGGGAIWFNHLYQPAKFSNVQFVDNVHEFGHGVGAGMMILEMHSKSSLDMSKVVFRNNKADSGAGYYIKDINTTATVNIDGTFIGNEAVYDKEYGCRGGVAWIQNVAGSVVLKGLYENNKAIGDRTAVFANNRIMTGGRVTIDGTFRNNTCTKGGSVWDTLYGFHNKAQLTIANSSIFEENTGENNNMLVRLLSDKLEAPNGRNIIRYEPQWKESNRTWEFVGGVNSTGNLHNRRSILGARKIKY